MLLTLQKSLKSIQIHLHDLEFATAQISNQHGVIDSYPQGRISVLYDLLNHLGLDAQLVSSSQGEVELTQLDVPGDILREVRISDFCNVTRLRDGAQTFLCASDAKLTPGQTEFRAP